MNREYWIVGNVTGTEFVKYFNPTGNVIHFTNDRSEAAKTICERQAAEWRAVANRVYKRNFRADYIVE